MTENYNEFNSLVSTEFLEESEIKTKINNYYKHLKATSFGYIDNTIEKKKCKCCNYPINNKPYSIFENTDKFSVNGAGYPLFFKFISFLILILIFPFSFLAIFNMNHNMKGNFCTEFKPKEPIINNLSNLNDKQKSKIKYFMIFYCYSHFINETKLCEQFFNKGCYKNYDENCELIAIKNYDENLKRQECDDSYYYKYSFINALNKEDSQIYMMMNVFAIFILYLFFEKFQNYIQNKIWYYDQENLSNLDYCLEVSNLNYNMKYYNNFFDFKKKIHKEIRIFLNDKNIIEIHPILNLSTIQHLKKKLIKLKDKINLTKYNDKLYGTNNLNLIEEYKKKFLIEKDIYKKQLTKFYKCEENYFTGTTLICFKYPKNLNDFVKRYSNKNPIFNFKDYIVNIKGIVVKYSNEPSDIIWNNFHYSKFNKFFRNLYSTFVLLMITFLLFSYILYSKIEYINEEEEAELFENNIFISLVIILSNLFIEEWAISFGKFNKPLSKSDKFSLALRTIYKFKFFIYSLISLFAALILFNFYGKEGLILSLNTLFLAEIISAPIFEILINLEYIELFIKRKLLKHFFDLYPKPTHISKKVFTKQRFELEIYYSDSMKIIATALFYAPIFPPIIFYSILSMIINYVLFKYVLIERSNKKLNYSSIITINLMNELEYLLLIFSLGIVVKELLVSYINIQPFNLSTSSLFCLGFSIFNIIFPLEHLDKLFNEDIVIDEVEKSYEDMKTLNTESYEKFNPLSEILEDYELLNKL